MIMETYNLVDGGLSFEARLEASLSEKFHNIVFKTLMSYRIKWNMDETFSCPKILSAMHRQASMLDDLKKNRSSFWRDSERGPKESDGGLGLVFYYLIGLPVMLHTASYEEWCQLWVVRIEFF